MRANAYNQWLYSLVDLPRHRHLLEHLHQTEFEHFVPNDQNRALDGERLREVFIDTVLPQGGSYLPDSRCSVLEMLIGVAHHLEHQLAQGPDEMGVPGCFETLLRNLDLYFLNDRNYNSRVVENRLRVLMNRTYNFNGKGGLFPLKYPNEDQRDIEIWWQMMGWLSEKYDF